MGFDQLIECWVLRSISILSLTRPFHNCAIRDAAMTSRLSLRATEEEQWRPAR